MKNILSWIFMIGFAVTLGMISSCDNDDGSGEDDYCDYETASEICQQAYDCCNQFLDFYEDMGQPMADQLNCEGYTCFGMTDAVCEGFIATAVDAEETFDQDWPDCY